MTNPIATDETRPLPHKKHEAFANAVASGEVQVTAYRQHVAVKPKSKGCNTAASSLARRLDVKARIIYLREQITAGTISPHSSEEQRRKQQALERLRTVYDHKDTKPSDLLKALELEAKLAGWTEENKRREDEKATTPDPVFLREYLAKCEALGLHPLHESERVHGVVVTQPDVSHAEQDDSDTEQVEGDPPAHPPHF